MDQYTPDIPSSTGKALKDYMETGGWMTQGNKTKELQKSVSSFLGTKHCTAVTSGTTSLYVALRACGVGIGDTVIVPAYTMIATANAVRMCGARPLFVDIEDKTLCLDPKNVRYLLDLWGTVKAVIYVAFNGRCGNIHKVREICTEYKIHMIEDACQAFGSQYHDKYIGTIGDIGCFSLSPYKTINTGQGGLLVTDSDELQFNIDNIKDHGKTGPDVHDHDGVNLKYTDLQAVAGIEQMNEIKKRINKKKNIAKLYAKKLRTIVGVKTKNVCNGTLQWMIDIYVDERDDIMEFLKHRGIQTRKMYPPIYQQKCYDQDLSLPVTEEYASRGLWLPSSPNMLEEDINTVFCALRRYYG